MPNEWWENYKGEDTVLIEDLGIYDVKLGDFLKIWADRYGFRGQEKFSSVTIRPKKIVVTSNYRIREIWPNSPQTYLPLERRFKERFISPREQLSIPFLLDNNVFTLILLKLTSRLILLQSKMN